MSVVIHGRFADLMDAITTLRHKYRSAWLDQYTDYRLGTELYLSSSTERVDPCPHPHAVYVAPRASVPALHATAVGGRIFAALLTSVIATSRRLGIDLWRDARRLATLF